MCRTVCDSYLLFVHGLGARGLKKIMDRPTAPPCLRSGCITRNGHGVLLQLLGFAPERCFDAIYCFPSLTAVWCAAEDGPAAVG